MVRLWIFLDRLTLEIKFWAKSVPRKILLNDKMSAGLSDRFFSSCITVGLKAKRCPMLSPRTKLNCITIPGDNSVKILMLKTLVLLQMDNLIL